MVTLISVSHGDGRTRRCDATCYRAKKPACTCVCGGMNHGVGLRLASENAVALGAEIVEAAVAKAAEAKAEWSPQLTLPLPEDNVKYPRIVSTTTVTNGKRPKCAVCGKPGATEAVTVQPDPNPALCTVIVGHSECLGAEQPGLLDRLQTLGLVAH